ncbi:MAG: cytochrome-c peroxidase, partial [Flavobacteriales bacterium]
MLAPLLFAACQKEVPSPQKRLPLLPDQPYSYNTPPANSFFNPFGDSAVNNDVATLGRVLFYDTQLSHNNSGSCGSCHRQINGFADPRNFSMGFENGLTGRNTQTIVNTGTQTGFFWDLREKTLDHMVLQPIANHIEMGVTDTLELENRVKSRRYYKELFTKAFGSEDITTKKIGLALAQFVISIVSVSTRYDVGRMQTQDNRVNFPNFNEQENLGRHLFFSKFPCSQCHGGVNLDGSLSAPKNIGLERDYLDNGMIGILPEGD